MRHTTKLNKWRNIICSWIGRLKIFKMFIIHNLIYKASEKQNRKPRIRSPLIFNKTDLYLFIYFFKTVLYISVSFAAKEQRQ